MAGEQQAALQNQLLLNQMFQQAFAPLQQFAAQRSQLELQRILDERRRAFVLQDYERQRQDAVTDREARESFEIEKINTQAQREKDRSTQYQNFLVQQQEKIEERAVEKEAAEGMRRIIEASTKDRRLARLVSGLDTSEPTKFMQEFLKRQNPENLGQIDTEDLLDTERELRETYDAINRMSGGSVDYKLAQQRLASNQELWDYVRGKTDDIADIAAFRNALITVAETEKPDDSFNERVKKIADKFSWFGKDEQFQRLADLAWEQAKAESADMTKNAALAPLVDTAKGLTERKNVLLKTGFADVNKLRGFQTNLLDQLKKARDAAPQPTAQPTAQPSPFTMQQGPSQTDLATQLLTQGYNPQQALDLTQRIPTRFDVPQPSPQQNRAAYDKFLQDQLMIQRQFEQQANPWGPPGPRY